MASSINNSFQPSIWPWRKIVVLVVILVVLYVILPQVKVLSPSLHSLVHARLTYVLSAVILFVSTYFVAALMYILLRKHRLGYWNTLLVQVSSGFANRLLPAGLGGMGLIAQYLRSQKHSVSEAISVVGMDNTIGMVGHFILFFSVIIFSNVTLTQLKLPHITEPIYFILGILAVLVILSITFRRFRSRLMRNLKNILNDVFAYRSHPIRLGLSLINSIVLTLLYISVLWCSSRALNINLPITKILVVFTAGALIGTATPTPGGLIGAEAGLFGGFIAYGVAGSFALAATLLYRLITYWLPIIPGALSFVIAQRKFNFFR